MIHHRVQTKKIFSILIGLGFSFSSAILAFQFIIWNHYSSYNNRFTFVVSFFCSLFFYFKTYKYIYEKLKNNLLYSVFSMILSFLVWNQFYVMKACLYKSSFNTWAVNPYRLSVFILSLFAFFYIGIFVFHKIKEFFLGFYKKLDTWDKKCYIITSFCFALLILVAYSFCSKWYLQYDQVYSIDSKWIYEVIFPGADYYDIRHPILNIFTFPIWTIANTFVTLVFPRGHLHDVLLAVVLQILNSQFLILIGLQLKLLTKKKMAYFFYIFSFPTILYTLCLEKYQMCVFFVVLYVFAICNKKEKSTFPLICAAGMMPTSCVIGISEFFVDGKMTDKLKKIVKIIFVTLLIFICFGRGHLLREGMDEVLTMKKTFSTPHFTVSEKMIATTKMVQNTFIALPSKVFPKKVYWWDRLEKEVSLLSLVIIGFVIVGIWVKRESLFTKVAACWFFFAFILFGVLNWDIHEAPLFSVYFSWAVIPLFLDGLDWLLEKMHVQNNKIVYAFLLLFMVMVNVPVLAEIGSVLF